MKKFLFIPLSLSVLVVSAQSLNRKAVFTKGQQLERVAAIKMIIGMDMMGQSIEINNTNTVTTLVEVKNASAKDFALASTVKRVVTSMAGMGQEMSYDTDKKDASAPSELTKKADELVGKTNNLVVDGKGVIISSDDSTTKDSDKAAFMGMSGGLVNMGNKAGALYDLVANLPAKAVKVGDTWVDSVVTKEGKTVSNYKVLEIKGDEALVGVDGTVAQSGQVENQGMTIDLNMAGTAKGSYTLEVASGVIRKRLMEMNATGTMEVAGQSIPFTMKLNMDEGVTRK
ncbi:DUF6263 family protein [Paraflavitalea sp. CAU 1676]|uniref:DUF6263 family protein n=1 Tax=Paraflavitalea sp. CAU 1676 TaxID=3032598 RepID=UPI0023D9E08E|nr:DUF6263 family protein [Paraflavitalea sp. CAU 1676]MDF2187426.1 DUF6263 family protein [Paraflavitalea sp. CAU 1676]